MRMFRVLVVGVLVAGGLAMLRPGASASVPALSKTCKSLKSLDKNLNKVVTSSKYDSGAANNLSKSFRQAANDRSQECQAGLLHVQLTVVVTDHAACRSSRWCGGVKASSNSTGASLPRARWRRRRL